MNHFALWLSVQPAADVLLLAIILLAICVGLLLGALWRDRIIAQDPMECAACGRPLAWPTFDCECERGKEVEVPAFIRAGRDIGDDVRTLEDRP